VTQLYLVEPDAGTTWFPFADARPICEMRAGIWLIRERWEAICQAETAAIFGPPHLRAFTEDGVPPVRERSRVSGPAVVGRSDFAPSGVAPELGGAPARLVNDGTTVGWWVPEGADWDGEDSGSATAEIDGLLLAGAHDLVTALEHFLPPDAADFTRETNDGVAEGCTVIGDPADVVVLGATVEPGVVFDVREGPVIVEQHAYVTSGARVVGPTYVGPGSQILGQSIHACVIGPRCKVRGEVSHTVFVGYANKAHEGFVGHTVIGRWVNLGAGTTTSNLKNTYGPVRLRLPSGQVETGLQFLGSLIGDHVKTAIGTQLNTGTLIGAGANVFGAARPPKYVAPFAWGDTGQLMGRDAFFTIAERVLPRRGVTVTEPVRQMLGAIYDHATAGHA
jgi:UDP-N-acetylglucosamine diphosphorylase/glucosamine-1-phosphate N-acetyltransferase